MGGRRKETVWQKINKLTIRVFLTGTFTVNLNYWTTFAHVQDTIAQPGRIGSWQIILTMAAADDGAKPLQNAMKMAKLAIQLDGGNKHKVVILHSVAATTTRRCKPQEIACQRCKQTEGGGSC